jgi:hypothetical protein
MLPANATHSIIHANVAYALTRAMPAASRDGTRDRSPRSRPQQHARG